MRQGGSDVAGAAAWDAAQGARSGPPASIEIDPEALRSGRDWHAIFGRPCLLRVEIGVGVDPFLIEMPLREPGFGYVGFEYSRKRVEAFKRKAAARGARGVRIVRCDPTPHLYRFFLPGQVDAFYVHFPDPWPKKRHAKKRCIQLPVTTAMASRLRAGGRIALRTDVRAYAEQMVEVLEATPCLRNRHGPGRFAPGPEDPAPTRYERKYVAQGRRIYYLAYERAPGAVRPYLPLPPAPRIPPRAGGGRAEAGEGEP